jgi:hypothetical protein
MRALQRFGIAALAFTIVAAPFTPGRAAQYHGAIAVWLSDDGLSWGWSTNYPTQSRADRSAIAQCANSGCEVVMRFWNGACGALAMVNNSDGQAWGAAWRNSRRGAEAAALSACATNGIGGCRVVASVCTSRP